MYGGPHYLGLSKDALWCWTMATIITRQHMSQNLVFSTGFPLPLFIGQVPHSQSDLESLTHLLPGSLTLPFTDTSVSVCDFKLRVSAGTILTLRSFPSVSFRKKAQAELVFLCPCSSFSTWRLAHSPFSVSLTLENIGSSPPLPPKVFKLIQ